MDRTPLLCSSFLYLVLAVLLATGSYKAGAAGLDSLVYNSRNHWLENWTFPKGTLEITLDGRVRPRFIKKNINASLNASEFIAEKNSKGESVRWGGILGAGSNPGRAANILDGNIFTSWSPAPTDELKKWWVEVDLGRLVTATRIAVKFSPGRPFEQFSVYASNGQEAFFPGSKVKDYKLVGRTTQPNSQEVLEYTLEKEVVDGEEVPRQPVRYVYLELTSHPEDPGQLAELEVHALGDNIMLGTLERFGSLIIGFNDKEVSGQKVADGNFLSRENLQTKVFEWRRRGWLRVDLGSLFWMDTVRILGFQGPGTNAMLSYKLFTSDGTTVPGSVEDPVLRNFAWQEVGSLERNPPPGETAARFIFEESFSLRPVRYIFFSNRNNESDRGPASREEVTEFQAFGEGFVPGATLTSTLIALGTSSNLTAISWQANTPPGTAIEIRTRTGDQVEEITHYYCRNGEECEKRKWDQEMSLFKSSGPVVVEQRPDTTWSGWSRPYVRPGEGFASPSPRRFLLIQAKLVGRGPQLAPTLNKVVLFYADPVARELLGHVEPSLVRAARPDTFSYFIEPSFAPAHSGFDEVLILTPNPARLSGVTVGDTHYEPPQLDSVYTTADSLWLRLPVRVRRQTMVEVQFESTIYDDNTFFDVLVANSGVPGSYQRVAPLDDRATTVRLPLAPELLKDAAVQPPVFTPNGDGINDEAAIQFTVLKLNQARPVTVRIYDLRGRMVRELEVRELNERTGLSGRYRSLWDGRDRTGILVAPGIYLCRIKVDAEREESVQMRMVAVAF